MKAVDVKQVEQAGKRPVSAGSKFSGEKIGPAPDYLGEEAQALWAHYAAELGAAGRDDAVNRTLLENLCVAQELAREAYLDLRNNGTVTVARSGYECPRAAVSMLSKMSELVLKLSKELAVTPLSNMKIPSGSSGKRGKDRLVDGLK